MESGGPTQTRRSPFRAAGNPPILTLGEPTTTGPPTCGILAVTLGRCALMLLLLWVFPWPPLDMELVAYIIPDKASIFCG